jgi:acyl-coenzyme A synthetase/AMP-(fatty) acid ligase
LSPELQQRFEDTYNCPVLIIYGATEFAGAVAGWTVPMHRQFIDSKRGSVGRAMPGCDLRTVDEVTGETLPPGDVGLLEVRTVQIGRDGWLRTTDLAVIDEDGFVWLKGRADGAINRGGFKILPEEIVQALKEHPDVADAAVVGLSDERLGQVPVAAVELRAGASLTEPALMEFARANLTRYHVPVAIRIVESLPRSAAMKPILPEVRALFGAP